MPADFKAELVGCFGSPVAENPSGVMQEAAFRALNLNWRYLLVEVPPEKLRDAVIGVRAFGIQGINLTIPHIRVYDYPYNGMKIANENMNITPKLVQLYYKEFYND